MSILEVKDLKKSFGKTEVLKGVSFTLEEGEVLEVLTPFSLTSSPNLLSNYQEIKCYMPESRGEKPQKGMKEEQEERNRLVWEI